MSAYPVADFYSNYVQKNPLASKQDILKEICETFNIANLVYLRVVGESPFDPRTTLIGTYSEAWNERYQAKQYYFIDPLIQVCMASEKATLWSSIPRDDANVQLFFSEAAEYDIPDSGVIIPLDLSRPGCAVLSVNTNFSREDWDAGQDGFIADLQRVGQLIHQSVLDDLGDQEFSKTLMPTEAEMLKWISKGRSSFEISQITGISLEAVELDLENGRRKLAANSNSEAAETAMLRKLIAC
ncbi:autoinducer binding domain-containing protein [Sulfitobacter sp. R18_1]|uniref:helix-turn-helix transcriptional regulator n=1 Tax=Sulfitobacter sp. R18_1 TaxID=2821104 RepID=UPI001ADA4FC8|nr:autoinducer binding domain-containing protein [Sulfitobacter sp. R18_1]MBO9428061.1 autoinducer binding domain-containing protein [Sulfitobacter sp. R18_1]